MEIKICHIYPDVLNLYGDLGNIITLQKRLLWRGIKASVTPVRIGEALKLASFDIAFIGGGQDFEQEILMGDLHGLGKDKELRAAIEDGLTALAICGGYQMLGAYYETHEGNRCDFIGALDFYTVGASERMIGNYMFSCGGEIGEVVGFENHSGKTRLGAGVSPLGTVITGFGNNGEDKTEGARYKNVFGTYSHGPLLPKNPRLADVILKTALKRRYGVDEISPLFDESESRAHDEMAQRLRR